MKRLAFFFTLVFTASFLLSVCAAQETNTLPSGDKYIGEWKDGQPNGQGTLIKAIGANYVGEVRNGEPSGQGTETWTNGTWYSGEWRDGKPNGSGTFVFSSGHTLVGEFKDGNANGRIIFSAPNGTNTKGEWRDGKPYTISGTNLFRDGTIEVGTWNHDGTKCGGRITSKDGHEYEGDWKLRLGSTELPDGMGAMTWPEGHKYVGQFRDGKMDGNGKMIYPDGKIQEGMWKDGKFVGASTSAP